MPKRLRFTLLRRVLYAMGGSRRARGRCESERERDGEREALGSSKLCWDGEDGRREKQKAGSDEGGPREAMEGATGGGREEGEGGGTSGSFPSLSGSYCFG